MVLFSYQYLKWVPDITLQKKQYRLTPCFFQTFKLYYFQDVTVTWFEADGKTIKEQIRVSGCPTPEVGLLKGDLQTQNSPKGK